MSDIAKRLRDLHVSRHASRSVVQCDEATILEAASEIDRLTAAATTAREEALREGVWAASVHMRKQCAAWLRSNGFPEAASGIDAMLIPKWDAPAILALIPPPPSETAREEQKG